MSVTATDYAGDIMRRNGAYLIQAHDPYGDTPGHQLFDCASSLPVAKRLLRRLAADLGYVGPFRWEADRGLWQLYGREGWAE